ncbi:MAG: hypothetical protein WD045_08280 [Pirellulaceae bacterium]
MIRTVYLSIAILVAALGCQNQQQPFNPFGAYPQRLAPPPTGANGQSATGAPYYQPQSGQAAPGGNGQQFPPPPANFQPQGAAPSATQQQGTWRGVSQAGSNSGVVQASYDQEIPPSQSSSQGLQLNGMPANDASNTAETPMVTSSDGTWTSMQPVR